MAGIDGQTITQDFDAALHKAPWSDISREGLERIPRVHDTYLNVQMSGRPHETEVIYSGLPAVPRVANDQVTTPQVSFQISPKVVYRHDEYRYQYVYTKVAADDDQYSVIRDVIGTMGEGAAYRMEVVAASIFNNGQDATEFATWDGLSIFNAAHQILDGASTTYSNITAAGGPTYAMVHTIVAYFKRILNDQGFYAPVEIESIQVAPELAPLWRQLLKSMTAYDRLSYTSGTGGATAYGNTTNDADGVVNVSRDMGMTPEKVVENHYLTTTEDTIVVGRDKKLNMFVREAPNTDTYNINDPRAMAHRIQMRFAVGATDARRVLLIPGS